MCLVCFGLFCHVQVNLLWLWSVPRLPEIPLHAVIPVSVEKNTSFLSAFALQSYSRNCSPAPDSVFLKLIFLRVLLSGGVLFSQKPVWLKLFCSCDFRESQWEHTLSSLGPKVTSANFSAEISALYSELQGAEFLGCPLVLNRFSPFKRELHPFQIRTWPEAVQKKQALGRETDCSVGHRFCGTQMVYSSPCLETDTNASTPAHDHSGPAWSYRPFAKQG